MRSHTFLIEALYRCADACEHSAHISLDEPDLDYLLDNIKIQRDCADICLLTARMLSKGSIYVRDLVELCITVCRDCAEECDGQNMAHCSKCARSCRECEEACRKFVAVNA